MPNGNSEAVPGVRIHMGHSLWILAGFLLISGCSREKPPNQAPVAGTVQASATSKLPAAGSVQAPATSKPTAAGSVQASASAEAASEQRLAEYRAPYEASVAKLQAALRDDDREAVARLVSYPLRVNVDRCPKHIENPSQLGRYYEVAFPAKLRKRVIADEPPYFTSWRGLGVASGELWLEDSDDGEPKVFATNTDVWDVPELPCSDRVIEATPPSLSGRWHVVAAFLPLPDVDPAKAWSAERSGWLRVDADRVQWDYSNRRGSCRIDHFARETEEPIRPVTPAADGLRSYDGHTRFVRLDCRSESGGNVASVGRSGAGGLYYLGPERIAVAGDGFKWMVMAKYAEGRRSNVVATGKPCGRPGVGCAPGLVCVAQGGYRDERCELLERY